MLHTKYTLQVRTHTKKPGEVTNLPGFNPLRKIVRWKQGTTNYPTCAML